MYLTDKELIDAYTSGHGDQQAYDQVVRWIRGVLRAQKWNPHVDTEDVVSQTTYDLFLNLQEGKFGGESTLKTYVQRMARYTLIDLYRRRKSVEKYVQRMSGMIGDERKPVDPEEYEERLYLVSRVMERCSADCRSLWNMHLVEKLNYKRIGQILNINENAVKQRFFQCRETARQIRNNLS